MTNPLLSRTAELASQFIDTLGDRPVGVPVDLTELIDAIGADLPHESEPPQAVIEHLYNTVSRGIVASAGGRYFGFVIGSSLPAAVAADWLVSAWDQNCGFYVLSPAGVAVESIVSRWIKDICNLPAEAAVGFVSGCQMANFMGLAAARQALLSRLGWDAALQGLTGAPPVRIITSAQSPGTIYRALGMLGLGADRAIRIPCDDQGRMKPTELAKTLASATTPAIVSAQAGNVDTGAFDPLRGIAAICKQHSAWLHIDGAFGLWASASPALRHLTDGVELADSWATDAHKWLNVPYDSGVVIVRDRDALIGATRYPGGYLVRSDDVDDPFKFTPESSRRARAMPIYAALKSLGRDGLTEMIDRCCRLAQRMAKRLSAGGVEIINDVVLNQVLFRFSAPQGRDNVEYTRAVVNRIQRDGTCWLGSTTWKDRPAVRISVCSWRTTQLDIDRSAAAILRCLLAEHTSK